MKRVYISKLNAFISNVVKKYFSSLNSYYGTNKGTLALLPEPILACVNPCLYNHAEPHWKTIIFEWVKIWGKPVYVGTLWTQVWHKMTHCLFCIQSYATGSLFESFDNGFIATLFESKTCGKCAAKSQN